MLSVDVQRYGERHFQDFIKAQPGIGNLIANAIAERYKRYLQQRYLSGQVLGVRTDETRGSVKFFKLKTGVFGVRPGYGITGRLNYLYRFERGDKPFMRPSFDAYVATGEPLEIASRIYNAMQKRTLR